MCLIIVYHSQFKISVKYSFISTMTNFTLKSICLNPDSNNPWIEVVFSSSLYTRCHSLIIFTNNFRFQFRTVLGHKKYPTIIRLLCLTIIGHFNHGTDFYNYSVAYGVINALFHTFIIGLRPATRLMISSCRVVTALALITRAPPYLPPCWAAGLHTLLIGFRLTPPLSQAPLLGQDELTRRKRNLDTRGLCVRLHTFTFPQSQTPACLSANLFPSNFDSKAIWHFSASWFGCCRNPNWSSKTVSACQVFA